MPTISPFPACCGASIITGFAGNPDAGCSFETEVVQGRWGPMQVPKKDENGNPVVKETYAQQFVKQIDAHKKGGDHAFFGILNESQMNTNWPKILKQCGFEFVGQWNNTTHGKSPNYLFVLPKHESGRKIPGFRDIPKQWLALQEEEGLRDATSPSEAQEAKAA